MKRFILPALVIIAVVGVAILAYLASQHYQNTVAAKEAEAVAEQRKEEAETTGRIKALEAQVEAKTNETNLMREECAKGAVAYGKLSPSVKRLTPAPNCGQ